MSTISTPVVTSLLQNVNGGWEKQLDYVVKTMREMSRQTDPQKMVREYGQRVKAMLPTDRFFSLSRRNLEEPQVRITRSNLFKEDINPWQNPGKLPLLHGGVFAELIWGDEPVIIDELDVAPDDPAAPYLEGMGSLVAVPNYDQGEALNMVVQCRKVTHGFSRDVLPQQVMMSNLFGRATHNLVLSQELARAYEAVERELSVVADIQQSLLPTSLPSIPTLDLAVRYRTSRHAGGDLYDFFPLPDGKWGILMADVSGHGTPAAVIMAVTHSIAHTHHGDPDPPARLLSFVNQHLTARYTSGKGTFVTAFYGIYDPANRIITYSSAGHCPPRIRRCNGELLLSLDESRQLPLGIDADEQYTDRTEQLHAGDAMLIYTDGITEARSPQGEFFGVESLDRMLLHDCNDSAADLLSRVMEEVRLFTCGSAAKDDQTLLAVKVR